MIRKQFGDIKDGLKYGFDYRQGWYLVRVSDGYTHSISVDKLAKILIRALERKKEAK